MRLVRYPFFFAACLVLSAVANAADDTAAAADKADDGKSKEALRLESTVVTGNRELPKVMSIVPWKKAQPGEIAARPSSSLLNEILSPVDREVFRRQLRYYEGLRQKDQEKESDAGSD